MRKMTHDEVKKKLKEKEDVGDKCPKINGFYISTEEFNPIIINNILYITEGINIEVDEIKEII